MLNKRTNLPCKDALNVSRMIGQGLFFVKTVKKKFKTDGLFFFCLLNFSSYFQQLFDKLSYDPSSVIPVAKMSLFMFINPSFFLVSRHSAEKNTSFTISLSKLCAT